MGLAGDRMGKIPLQDVADEFELMNSETHVFYNTETGEFAHKGPYCPDADWDFDDPAWIAEPSQDEVREYDIMVEFVETVGNRRKQELLGAALDGKGPFRAFKDTLWRVDLREEWFAFKHMAYVEIARKWCDRYGIEYTEEPGGDVG